MIDRNAELLERARRVIPGGVASVNRTTDRPLVFVKASGAVVTDANGRDYIDYNCAFGATILGHCDPHVGARVAEASASIDLVGIGALAMEAELAEMLTERIPCAEQIAYCNSGSEATYHAVRLSRAATGRKLIVKFQGCYHGWHDYVAMNVISRPDRIGVYDPLSAGSLDAAGEHTIVLPFNDIAAIEELMAKRSEEIAAIILEPIQHNIGAIVATDAFLQTLRELCDASGTILIFDEVITGFRHATGGYQSMCGITPDLATFGKAIANGYHIAILAGPRVLMERLAPPPVGDVFMAGTYNGHPGTIAATIATIEQLERPGRYEALYAMGDYMRTELDMIVDRLGLKAQAGGFGSVWQLYFFEGAYDRYEDLLANDAALDTAFRRGLVDAGFLSSTLPLKRWNFTMAHSREQADQTLQAAEDVLKRLSRKMVA